MKGNKWHDVGVAFTLVIVNEDQKDGPWFDLTYERAFPSQVQHELNLLLVGHEQEGVELDFNIRSSGYYEPMSMYGGPDHVGWPEEGEDERTLEGVYILIDGKQLKDASGKPIKLSKASADELEGLYQEEINEEELPDRDYEGDRGDCMKDGD